MADASIVSIVPYDYYREFPGVFPGVITMNAAEKDSIQIVHVKDGKSYLYLLENKGFNLTEPGETIAAAFCKDFINSQLFASDDAAPGLFWVPGHVNEAVVRAKYKTKLEEAQLKQENWFKNLVKAADDDWQKYHQYKTIADIQRFAAKALGLKREWIDILPEDKVNCPACGIEIRKGIAICFNCKAILDSEKAKQFVFSKVG